MAPPSKETVTGVFFTEGVNIGPGLIVNSQNAAKDKVEMELCPAGVRILGKNFHAIIPYARIKSISLG